MNKRIQQIFFDEFNEVVVDIKDVSLGVDQIVKTEKSLFDFIVCVGDLLKKHHQSQFYL